MDLTTLATTAVAAKQQAQEATARLRQEQALIQDRTHLKTAMREFLDVEVDESDIVRRGDKHFVIVDGLQLGLGYNQGYQHDPHLAAWCVTDSGALRMDTSLSCSQIRSLVDLGRILEPGRRHTVTIHSPAPGRDSGYHSRYYKPGQGLLEYGATGR